MHDLSGQIKQVAIKEGIDVVRITHADPFEGYLLPNSRRHYPHLTLPDAKSIIVKSVSGHYFSFTEPSSGSVLAKSSNAVFN